MTAAELEAGRDFGRYKDVDGDGIPWRTLPGTHPTKGAYFTRGTTRDAYARYSEAGPDYVYNVERLLRKFATAANLVPAPRVRTAARKTRLGVLYFGSTAPAMDEALEALAEQHIDLDAMRLRAFPFPASVAEFIEVHDHVFVVEQNRDAQMRSLLAGELEFDPARLIPVLHFDGTPITARFITQAIAKQVLALAAALRGFSGDKAQLVPLIKGAIGHGGAAFLDVVSPCVTFNNHAGSTRSYDHVREHNEALNRIDFIDLAPEAIDLHAALHTVPRALNTLGESELNPGAATLARINAWLR
jgi:hypothetical protein